MLSFSLSLLLAVFGFGGTCGGCGCCPVAWRKLLLANDALLSPPPVGGSLFSGEF